MLQESWNKTAKESPDERWHLYFKSSPVSPLSFIRADTSLQNTSVSGLAVGIWPRGSRPATVAMPAKAVSVLHPKGGGTACPAPASLARQLPPLGLRDWSPQRAGSGDRALLPVCPAPGSCACSSRAPGPLVGTRLQQPLTPSCLAGQDRAPSRAGLCPRSSCSFGSDCRIPELLITSSSLVLPFNPRNILKN